MMKVVVFDLGGTFQSFWAILMIMFHLLLQDIGSRTVKACK